MIPIEENKFKYLLKGLRDGKPEREGGLNPSICYQRRFLRGGKKYHNKIKLRAWTLEPDCLSGFESCLCHLLWIAG